MYIKLFDIHTEYERHLIQCRSKILAQIQLTKTKKSLLNCELFNFSSVTLTIHCDGLFYESLLIQGTCGIPMNRQQAPAPKTSF